MSRAVTIGAVVRTADGALCRVISIGKEYDAARGGYGDADYADLRPLDTEDVLHLPVAELTRVPDPRNAKPPIAGLPETRPRCQWCRKPLDPSIDVTFNPSRALLAPRYLARTFDGWRGYGRGPETYTLGGKTFAVPLFHSLRCATQFAEASYRGGYRRASA